MSRGKAIVKNTMILYLRMAFILVVSLYTSRVILNTLGITDYGIYNAVGGVVTMFTIVTSSMTGAISRFITFELGKNDAEKLNKVFCTAINVQLVMAVLVLFIAEIAGIWFLNHKMNISGERIDAANWVMHCSILIFIVNILSVPYNSTIVAHEKMTAFAYISILEASLKLIVVLSLNIVSCDKLKYYALLLLVVSIIVRFIYSLYCKNTFKECTYHFVFDKKLLKEMLNFAGLSFVGNGIYVVNTHGINILINLFFGVTLNAARGIANQVESSVQYFVSNFMKALNPQITKAYARGDTDYLTLLVFRGAKMSFFLMWFFSVPICLETELILKMWLKIVPDYTVAFVRWTFINGICYQMGNTLITALFATGDIKKYQVTVSLWIMLLFPLTYLAYKRGFSVLWAYYIYFFIYAIMIYLRVRVAKDLLQISIKSYFKEVVFKSLLVAAVSIIIPLYIVCIFEPSFHRLLMVTILSFVISSVTIYFIGLNKEEKELIVYLIVRSLKG